jgi:two-component system sensor histidine kinase YesM
MIQQFRFNNRFQLNVLPFPQELGERCHLPKMTLQPILENAILHGMEEKIGPGAITIRVVETDSRIVITISDDGAGMNEETLKRLEAKLASE